MANYYLSPSGNDSNLGTLSSPWFTLQKAWTVLQPGDTVYLRGGTYTYSIQQYLTGKNGTATSNIKIYAYDGEKPVITRATSFTKPGNYWHRGMVVFMGNYFHWKGIRFTGMYTNDNQVDSGFLAWDANNCVFELLESDNNVQGMIIENNSNNNLVLNSDFHDNYSNYNGTNGGNSDGLALTYMLQTNTNNTVRGCRFWNNGDDGLDTFENLGFVTIENCWSWHNGYNKGTNTSAGDGVGFKIGSDFSAVQPNILKRRYQNCLSWDNRNAGIHINEAEYRTEIYNCTFYKNGIAGMNFHYTNRNHIFRNVVSFANGSTDVEISQNSNSLACSCGVNGYSDAVSGWSKDASIDDFISVSWVDAAGPRKADGSLPDSNFLKLKLGSDLINTGVNVGLTFSDSKPDRGAYEYIPVTTNTTTTTTTVPVTISTTTTTTTVPVTISTTTTTTTVPSKVIKTANNNLSTKRLVITFTDGTTRTINNSTKPIKTVLTDYITKKVTVTYTDGSVIII
jgi:hypothetical protein